MMDEASAVETSSLEEEVAGELTEETHEGDVAQTSNKCCIRIAAGSVKDVLSAQLTLYNGKEKFSNKKSFFIISVLYVSHFFSAWGDRMWQFAITLFLLQLYPGSLLLVGVYGLVMQLAVVVFGTIVGDWVDNSPRMKVAGLSLLIQNVLVALCAVVFGLAFHYDISRCGGAVWVFSLVSGLVIFLGSSANLATVANTIAIERDWVVVIADMNKDTLAILNACMRRIDLCCKLMAPTLVGAIIISTGYLSSTIFVAGWNVVSFFAEFGLICVVYHYVPTLAHKKYRKNTTVAEKLEEQVNDDLEENLPLEDAEEKPAVNGDDGLEDDVFLTPKTHRKSLYQKIGGILKKLATPYITIKDGWRIYARQEIARVGIAMSLLYVTVLGFSGVTSAYFKTQGLNEALIGLAQGIGGIVAVVGTIVYVPIRKRVGTIRAGLFGMCCQFSMLLFCIAAVFAPGNPTGSGEGGYYSAHCAGSQVNTINGSKVTVAPTVSLPTSSYLMNTTSVLMSTPTFVLNNVSASVFATATVSISNSYSITPSPVPNSYSITPSPILRSISPSPTPGANNTTGDNGGHHKPVSVSLLLLLAGVLSARFGLWMFDLSVTQLLQEKVIEEERGVVSGVMNVFIAVMDMLHYILAIAAPNPQHFGILTFISVVFVGLGLLLYASYVHKVRGHLFHIVDMCKRCRKRSNGVEYNTSLLNENVDDDNDQPDGDDL